MALLWRIALRSVSLLARFKAEALLLLGLLAAAVGQFGLGASESHRPAKAERFRPLFHTTDCGAVSLYVACRLEQKPYSLDDLRQLTETSVIGTDMLALKKAAAATGFKVEACKCSFDALRDHLAAEHRYAILYLEKGHFTAAVGGGAGGQIRLVEPASGIQDMSAEQLQRGLAWDGIVLLLSAS